MIIASILKRKDGTKVDLRFKYHFKPEDTTLVPGSEAFMAAPHVAEVKDHKDIACLLSIPQGYCIHSADAEELMPQPQVQPEPVPQADMVLPESGAVIPDDNGDNKDELAAIRAKYEKLAGKRPHNRWTIDRIEAEISELEAQ